MKLMENNFVQIILTSYNVSVSFRWALTAGHCECFQGFFGAWIGVLCSATFLQNGLFAVSLMSDVICFVSVLIWSGQENE